MGDADVGHGFLGRGHHRVRFTDLSECFFGRLLLLKVPDPASGKVIDFDFTLLDVFPQARGLDDLSDVHAGG